MKKLLRFIESKSINYLLLLANIALFVFFLFKVSSDFNLTKFLIVLFIFAIVPGNLINTYIIKVNFSGLTKIFVQYLFGISFWIIFLFANTLILKIKLNNYVLISVVVGGILFLIFKNFRRIKIPSISLSSNLIILIFNISFFTYFSHTRGLLAAPLHDTVANSYLGAFLIKNNFASYSQSFVSYPPGGGILTGLFSYICGIPSTQIVLYLTVFSICITGLSMGLLIKYLFKSKYLGALMYAIPSFLLPLQTYEYLNGSKNSHIIMTPLFFISMIVLTELLSNKEKRLFLRPIVIASVVFFSITLIHFNYLLLSIPFFILITLSEARYKRFWKKIVFFGLILLVLFIPYFLYISKTNSGSAPLSTNEVVTIPFYELSLSHLKLFITSLLSMVNLELKFIIVLGIIVAVFSYIKKKNIFYLLPIIYLIVYYLYSKSGHPLVSAYASYDYYIVVLFAALIFFITVFFESKIIFITIFCWTLLLSVYNYRILKYQYNGIKNYSLLTKYDLQAFSWINNNIHDNGLFFSPYFSAVPKEERVYDLTPILYLATFTGKTSCPNFIGTGNSDCTKDFVKLLNNNSNTKNEEIVKLIKIHDIKYVYISTYKPWGEGSFINEKNNYLFYYGEEIFKNQGVIIVRLNID